MTDARSDVIAALSDGLPDNVLTLDREVVDTYSIDRAMFALPGEAICLVRARETSQVQHVMRVASRFGVPVVPQGARSGLSGAATASDGCILLNVERMDQVLEVDVANRLVVTQPGVMNADLSHEVERHGLYYPPDPSSWEFCSIGGNLSTNSGGLCCVKYGVTTDYVLALEVVLADGEVLHTGRRTVKGVAGYDLTRLIVGSEGTLGVITEATLLLRPRTEQPETVAAVFGSAETAAQAVSDVVACGVVPSLLEFMDRASIRAVNDAFSMGFSDDAAAVLLAQSDAGGDRATEEIRRLADVLESAGADEVVVADDPSEGQMLLAARRGVLTAFEKYGTTLIDDVCVPRSKLAELIERVEALAAEFDLLVGMVGHAGDGNFHPTVVFDPSDDDQRQRAERLFDRIMEVALDMGGTITGEHGVGTLKRALLEQEVGKLGLDLHRRVKAAFDPHGILNPGKVFEA